MKKIKDKIWGRTMNKILQEILTKATVIMKTSQLIVEMMKLLVKWRKNKVFS